MNKILKGGQRGFTLIELLIVVAILGILAAVIIPNVGAFLVTGTLNAANTEAENVKTASLAFYAENSVWPDTTDNLTGFLAGAPLKASYNFDNNGLIETATASGWNGITWDDTLAVGARKWKRG